MATLTDVLSPFDIAVADQALADIEVPVLTVPQAQGDVFIWPCMAWSAAEREQAAPVPPEGVAVVRGEATGNTHLLTAADGEVLWLPAPPNGPLLLLGSLAVAPGATAYLIHTDEHGANGIGPGTYELTGKREQADVVRRQAD